MTSASPIAVIEGVPIFLPQALGAALGLLLALTLLTLIALWRALGVPVISDASMATVRSLPMLVERSAGA